MKRKKLIKELTKLVIKNNIQNYESWCIDADTNDRKAKEFATFGTDFETANIIIRGITREVVENVVKEQKRIADFIYD